MFPVSLSLSFPSHPASPAPVRLETSMTTRAMDATHTETHTETPIRHPDLIIPRIYLCDLHTAQDPTAAVSLGITHIISVLDFHPTFPHEMKHIKKMHVRLSDNFREKITPHLDKTTAFIREALEEDPANKVLVRRCRYR